MMIIFSTCLSFLCWSTSPLLPPTTLSVRPLFVEALAEYQLGANGKVWRFLQVWAQWKPSWICYRINFGNSLFYKYIIIIITLTLAGGQLVGSNYLGWILSVRSATALLSTFVIAICCKEKNFLLFWSQYVAKKNVLLFSLQNVAKNQAGVNHHTFLVN